MNLHEQLTACGFVTCGPGTYRHLSGPVVQAGDGHLSLGETTVPVTQPEDLTDFCWARELGPGFAELRDTLAPWPARPQPHVAYRDGEGIRIHTREGDLRISEQGIFDLQGQVWPDDLHDPRHLYPCLMTPGGIIGVYQVEGGQSGEMIGTLTLTWGTRHARVDFQDEDAEDRTYLSARGWPDLTTCSRDAAGVSRLFAAVAGPG